MALRGRSRGGAGQGAVWVPEVRLRSTQGEQGWESQGMGRRECEGLWLGRGAGRSSLGKEDEQGVLTLVPVP